MSLINWFFLNLAIQLSSWGSWNQSSSGGGQWGMRLSQPWILDRFHLLSFSEASHLTSWQSCRSASSTPWLCWLLCTYFRWLWRYLFPHSSSRLGKGKSQVPPPFPRKKIALPCCPLFFSPTALGSHLVWIAFQLPMRWFRPFIEQLCFQLYSVLIKKKTPSLSLVHTEYICCRLLAFVFEALSKLMNGIWVFFLLSRYVSVGDEMWLLKWHIPTSVYETSRVTAPCVYLSRCARNKGVEIGAFFVWLFFNALEALLDTNTHIMNGNDAKPKASNAFECLFVFWTLASADLSTAMSCQCYHSASFSSWLLWRNCKEWEQIITQPHILRRP